MTTTELLENIATLEAENGRLLTLLGRVNDVMRDIAAWPVSLLGLEVHGALEGAHRVVDVKDWGTEGLQPQRQEDCPRPMDPACISASGDSICTGYAGGAGPDKIRCGYMEVRDADTHPTV